MVVQLSARCACQKLPDIFSKLVKATCDALGCACVLELSRAQRLRAPVVIYVDTVCLLSKPRRVRVRKVNRHYVINLSNKDVEVRPTMDMDCGIVICNKLPCEHKYTNNLKHKFMDSDSVCV